MRQQPRSCAIHVAILLLGFVSTAGADLGVRMGGQAVYDSDLDITWVADTNLALSNQFGLTLSGTEFDSTPNTVGSTGLVTWDNANAWIAGMNAANYLGFSDWRLPTLVDPDASCTSDQEGTTPVAGTASGFNCTGSEMGHLIYLELGGTPGSDLISTADPVGLAKFTNLPPGISHDAWSLEYALSAVVFAWSFEFSNGQQHTSAKVNSLFAMAVRDGDVGGIEEVPSVPSLNSLGLAVLGLGLAGLMRVAATRRR